MSTVTDECPVAESRAKLVAWWGETLATLEAINLAARRIATHAEREESPLYGCIDADDLFNFAGRLGDITTGLYDTPPVPTSDILDPTDDLPRLPPLPEKVAASTPDPSEETATELIKDTASKVTLLTDSERRKLIAEAVPSLAMAAATSDLLPTMFALTVEFCRRYYPGADHATIMVSFPERGRGMVHLPIYVADAKGGA